MLCFPSSLLRVDTGHSVDPHRAAWTAVFRDSSSASSCFRCSLSVQFSGAQRPASDPASRSPSGRMHLVAIAPYQDSADKAEEEEERNLK
ncbi:hypothetical protein AMECASPLE_007054 [Ameca splendens]|uniref:Uncharacterized protein n=1 Tax=Ameca splendens TaxID=208324 RepID=A0ABV0XNM1_9TELE